MLNKFTSIASVYKMIVERALVGNERASKTFISHTSIRLDKGRM